MAACTKVRFWVALRRWRQPASWVNDPNLESRNVEIFSRFCHL